MLGTAQVSRVPVVHGSALFQGGETQALAMCTVGSPEDEQRVGGVLDPGNRRLIVHYASPPYATNEVCFQLTPVAEFVSPNHWLYNILGAAPFHFKATKPGSPAS